MLEQAHYLDIFNALTNNQLEALLFICIIGGNMERILIVETDIMVAWSIERTLKRKGHEVVEILNNGEDLLPWVETSPVDLVIMEIDLQGEMTGIEVARNIFQSKKLSFLLMSTNAIYEYDELVQKNKCCRFIHKPFCFQLLEAAICELLQVG